MLAHKIFGRCLATITLPSLSWSLSLGIIIIDVVSLLQSWYRHCSCRRLQLVMSWWQLSWSDVVTSLWSLRLLSS
ncbi:hypothetical protein EI94DRAFT_1734465 [Lactarius quietus]|nr:hypothetical protein EI94DRAFT_1734465 [Lactarius quietus]